MKAKVQRGRGFRGTASYLLRGRGAIVGGTMAGSTPRAMAREYGEGRRLRTDVDRPVWHHSLSLPQGESLTPDRWHDVADAYMRRLAEAEGVDPDLLQWTAIRHGDTTHDHIHILASRIALDGSLIYGRYEARKAIQATQTLERDFGLTITPGLDDPPEPQPGEVPGGRASDGERGLMRRGVQPKKTEVRAAIDAAIEHSGADFERFIEALRAEGVRLEPNIASTGRVAGVRFAVDDDEGECWRFKASALGKAYSWSRLATTVGYEPDQHAALMERLASGEPERDQEAARAAARTADAAPGLAASAAALPRPRPLLEAEDAPAGDPASAASGPPPAAHPRSDDDPPRLTASAAALPRPRPLLEAEDAPAGDPASAASGPPPAAHPRSDDDPPRLTASAAVLPRPGPPLSAHRPIGRDRRMHERRPVGALVAPGPIDEADVASWSARAAIIERYHVRMQVSDTRARVTPDQGASASQIAVALYSYARDAGWEWQRYDVPDDVAEHVIDMARQDGRLDRIEFADGHQAQRLGAARARAAAAAARDEPDDDPLGGLDQQPRDGPGMG